MIQSEIFIFENMDQGQHFMETHVRIALK